jgi:hypothetical protein
MARSIDLLKQRNEKIYTRYKELYDINFLRHEKVLEVLSNEFYLENKSIEKIVLSEKKSLTKAK